MCQTCTPTAVEFESATKLGYKIADDGKLLKVTKSREIPKSLSSLRGQLETGEFEDFATEYLSRFPIVPRIASGDGIHEVFEKYRPGSCMAPSSKREMREVYADNPDDVVVVYWLKEDHELLESNGSALLWIGKERIYLDRVYSAGYACQSHKIISSMCLQLTQRYSLPIYTIYSSVANVERWSEKLSFRLSHPVDRPLPYADTLNWVTDYDDDSVRLSTESRGSGVCLDMVEGVMPDGEGGRRCSECGEPASEDYCSYTEDGECLCEDCAGYCEWCERTLSASVVSCETVEHNRRYLGEDIGLCECCIGDDFTRTEHGTLCEDSLLVESVEGLELSPNDIEENDYVYLDHGDHEGEVCQAENAVYLDYCEGYVYCDDTIVTHDGNPALEEDCTKLYNGEFALDENDETTELANGEFALTEDCVETVDGEIALAEDCTGDEESGYTLYRRRKPPQREFVQFQHYHATISVIPGLPFGVHWSRNVQGYYVFHLPTGCKASMRQFADRESAKTAILELWRSMSEEMRNDCYTDNPEFYQRNPGLGRIMNSRIPSA